MSILSRLHNVFRGEGLNREIDEELASHIDEAIQQGRDPHEARRAFGPALLRREESRDARLIAWVDSLRADVVFGWRQLAKRKVTSGAAILSLALAIGACTSAFRLIDALLLRPLPVANADHLYAVSRKGIGFDGKPASFDGWAYPDFQLMRAAVKGQAELIAVSYAQLTDLTYQSDREMEKAYLQYVSGWMFPSFGLVPAAGRLLTEDDDRKAGAHPYAVLSYDYWTRRFGRDPAVVGRTLHLGDRIYEIVGVGPATFTGTETGTVTDVFVPSMMHPAALRNDSTWHRTLAILQPGVGEEPVRERLHVTSRAFEMDRAKGFKGMSKANVERFINQTVVIEPAASGASGLQNDYRRSLLALGVLAGLVLLIACANVANLMTAQAAARAREMALRVSLGAGKGRLVQLVLLESACLALLSGACGGLFAWWSAPFVVARINPADNPARLALPADWRVLAFGLALTLFVTLLFGLAPALRASGVKPASALKGGDDPHSRRRLMHLLIGAQVAFCFLVLFVTGLFVVTLDRLSSRPTGFVAERLLAVDTVAQGPQSAVVWDQLADKLRTLPGVQNVVVAGATLLGGNSWNGFVSVDGAPPGPVLAYFLSTSPGFLDVMKLPLIEGNDFRRDDTSPGVALISEEFARVFFNGVRPIGRTFAKGNASYRVIGVVRDAPYRHIRESILPVAYVPIHSLGADGALTPRQSSTFLIRTAGENPLALAGTLRREIPRARPEFRVSNVRSQSEIVQGQTVRERLLAILAMFFAAVALLLAGIGLYGVLDHSVLQRRREIGIRVAIGAPAGDIARRVTASVFRMVLIGAVSGIGLGVVLVRYVESLLYDVKGTSIAMLILPAVAIVTAALLASIPAVVRALRIDAIAMLRSD